MGIKQSVQAGFDVVWEHRSDVLQAIGISYETAQLIYSQGFVDGAGYQLKEVETGFVKALSAKVAEAN